jgi:hypothetical protein
VNRRHKLSWLSRRQKRPGLPKSWYNRLKTGSLPAKILLKILRVLKSFLSLLSVLIFYEEGKYNDFGYLKYDLSPLANVGGIIIRWNFFFHRSF